MVRPKDALFWAGVVSIALYYVVQPVARWQEHQAPWTPDGTGECWTWQQPDGVRARCCRTNDGTWRDAALRPCDGAHPGHGVVDPTP